MAIKILTKNGIENTNIDGARNYHFNSGNRSGILKGAFNEGRFFTSSSNVIALDSCELRLSGHRIIIDEPYYITLSNRPSVATRYSMVAEIVVNDSSEPTFRLFIQPSSTTLRQQELFKTETGSGTYQLEIGRFTLTTAGIIEDIERTADIITGGVGGDGSEPWEVGEITTTTVSSNIPANVDIDYNEETKKYDFQFDVPRGRDGIVNYTDEEEVEDVSFVSYSNPNLLINGDFRVNQRGAASYTGSGSRLYTVDRWAITSSASVTSINTNSVSVSLLTQYQAFEQKIEDYEKLKGKTVTLSCKISNLATSSGNQLYLRYNSGDTNGTKQITGDGTYSLTFTVSNSATLLAVQIFSGSGSGITYSFDLEWMKLEIGSIATPFSPRPYAEELALCQRYYFKTMPSGTNAYYHITLGMVRGGIITLPVVLPREMRPYYTVTPKGNFQVLPVTGSNFNFTTGQTINVSQSSLSVIDIAITQSTMTDGHICQLRANNDLSATIEVDAEIY